MGTCCGTTQGSPKQYENQMATEITASTKKVQILSEESTRSILYVIHALNTHHFEQPLLLVNKNR